MRSPQHMGEAVMWRGGGAEKLLMWQALKAQFSKRKQIQLQQHKCFHFKSLTDLFPRRKQSSFPAHQEGTHKARTGVSDCIHS